MTFKDRLQYFDHCISGEKVRFQKLFSIDVFDSFDRSYEIYRDYIKSKNNVSSISCTIDEDYLTIHLGSKSDIEDLLTDNFPKRGISPIKTNSGIDIQIKLVEDMFNLQKEGN